MNLPKLEAKFANYIKGCYKAEDPKVMELCLDKIT